ncbi:legumain [Acyrthosiphon pisum]|uniref:legumain n=1 Tax=Acyrthosiphon pisum TaxID=7029 RepID=A0A8R2A164_ACYPI|nr:legumain [Acyrthosiphon pisum]|eukprot:XP_001943941.2 PREDICTED: legumain [Acyrthosiphon pisum]
MGVFSFVSLTLFAIGSAAIHVPYRKPWIDSETVNSFFGGKKWVVLVAGSDGWNNYRHQADICHAYQIIRENGIPKENIITMMVDDIANNPRNPTPGMIINQPNGKDVYKGVVIDYKGMDVNSTNFLKIITGDKKAMQSIGTGKVIEGGPHDKVFINFVDHGTTGILGFPDDLLYADELNDALKTMHASARYRMVLMYIEACKAGSMFDGILRDNTGVLAVTASGPRENSFGCYCRSQSGPYKTCLGDFFSVTWMENWDALVSESPKKKRTVFYDFNEARTSVTESNVMVYGDFRTGHETLSSFIGYKNRSKKHPSAEPVMTVTNKPKNTVMSSRTVYENSVQQELAGNELSVSERHHLSTELHLNNEMRLIIDKALRTIYSKVVKARPEIISKVGDFYEPNHLELSLDMFPCYKSILNKITESCFSLPRNPYALDRLTIFANFCVVDKHIHQLVEKLVSASCSNVHKLNIKNVY